MSANTKENRERIESLDMLALARDIFAHLPGWTVEDPDPDDPYARMRLSHVNVEHESGARAYLSRSTWPPEVHVGGDWPRLGDRRTGEEYAPRERPRIAFSPWREPKALAKDINRRFLSVFLPEWEKQRALRDEAAGKALVAAGIAGKLAAIFGCGLREYSEGWRMHPQGECYEVRVTRWGSVQFERLSTERPERAEELARLIVSWREAEPAEVAS